MPGMEKILRGILKYRATERKHMVDQFKRIRDKPEPTAVFITCLDSRMLASRFTMTNVGDMFIVRNAGNLVPNANSLDSGCVMAEPGALELGCVINNVKHIVVCGHSDCKAMNLLYQLKDECHSHSESPLEMWLKKYGESSVKKFQGLSAKNKFKGPLLFQGESEKTFEAYIDPESKLCTQDKLSQVNCLQQLQNIASYKFLQDNLANNDIHLHAMWFDVYSGVKSLNIWQNNDFKTFFLRGSPVVTLPRPRAPKLLSCLA